MPLREFVVVTGTRCVICLTPKKILAIVIALLTLLTVDSTLLIPERLWAAPMNAPSMETHLFNFNGSTYGLRPIQLAMGGRDLEQETGCNGSTYQVQPGDTITDVARRSGTSSQRVRECNGLTSNVVQAGQQLALPGAVTPGGSSAPGARVTRTYPQYSPSRYPPASRQQPSPYQGRPTWGPRRR
jgi:hypothetical protein